MKKKKVKAMKNYDELEKELLEKGEASLKWEVTKAKFHLEILEDFKVNTYKNEEKGFYEPYNENERIQDLIKKDEKINSEFDDSVDYRLNNLEFSNKEIIEITKAELPTFIVVYDNNGKEEVIFANHDEDKYVDTTIDIEDLIGKENYENFDFTHPDSFLNIPNVTIMYEVGKEKDRHWETYDLSSNAFNDFTDNLVLELKETVLKDELNAIKDKVKEDIIENSQLYYMSENEMEILTKKYERLQAEPTHNLKHYNTLIKEQEKEKTIE